MKHIFRSWNSMCSFLKVTPSQILQGEDLGPLQEIWMVERSPLSCWESGKPPGTFRLCYQDCHGICQGDWISLPEEAQDHWHWRRIIHEVLWQRIKIAIDIAILKSWLSLFTIATQMQVNLRGSNFKLTDSNCKRQPRTYSVEDTG